MALNAYARVVTDRLVVPVATGLVRVGATANRLTAFGLVMTLVGCGVVLSGSPRIGAWVLAVAVSADAFDGAVARLRGETSPFGSFFDSVADRVSDAAIFGTAAWLVRTEPLVFVIAIIAFAGAQLTSYVRAKAESLGWSATVGIIERPERLIVIIPAIHFNLLPLGLVILAVGGVVTVAQRLRTVAVQATPGLPLR